jgi:hypothetical protein
LQLTATSSDTAQRDTTGHALKNFKCFAHERNRGWDRLGAPATAADAADTAKAATNQQTNNEQNAIPAF